MLRWHTTVGAGLIGALLASSAALATGKGAGAEPAQGRVFESVDAFAVLSTRSRVEPENRMVRERLETLLPQLMAETDLDMWLVINREYAEDPVYFTLVPQPSFAARRTTMLVFHRQADGSVARLSVNRYPLGEPYSSAWAGGDLDAQWKALAEVIVSRNPKRIGINVSREWPVADGLTSALHARLREVLPAEFASRLVPAEPLVVRWLETRTDSELAVYPQIVAIARGVIAEAFSSRVITPGVTTTQDVAWYIRGRFESLGLPIWFFPDVNRQRQGVACETDAPFCGDSGVIAPGDVLHTDVGICYLKLCTDTQEMGYVARLDETDVPAGLKAAMQTGNRWQDLLTENFAKGRTGNEVLALTRAAASKARIAASVYTHPLGMFGHAPGPTIGMWDNQGPTPVQGDWPLYPNTVYAIEGNIKQAVPEWGGQLVQMKLEQDALFDGERVVYLAGRQTEWHVIR
jgi:Xaa-Pro aminopeptidase